MPAASRQAVGIVPRRGRFWPEGFAIEESNMKTATQPQALDLDSMSAAEIAKEIKRTMTYLSRLQGVLTTWASNAEEVLGADTVQAIPQSGA